MGSIVVGLGNSILCDDGVGVAVVRELRGKNWEGKKIDFAEGNVGGLRLMETLVGYDDAILVDAMVTGTSPPGTIVCGDWGDLPGVRHTWSSHDTRLSVALELGVAVGMKLPSRIRVWGIEVKDVDTFGEMMTPKVRNAVSVVIEEIIHYLRKGR